MCLIFDFTFTIVITLILLLTNIRIFIIFLQEELRTIMSESYLGIVELE
ncbi:hypothetical protein FACS1894190_15280 [Spirochaetia bacterium]|nr:hypothetical protein FACS1894190_15280 [Spirochaetia bacterium]